jgi:hypothetical protein
MTKEIYKTFEQWMNGNFLEVKEPRKKAYSKDELLLVEMGWKYGYDAGRAVEQALDKRAENARELGLDYEPVLKDNSNYRYDPPVAEPVAYLCENAVGHKYFRWKKPSSTYKPIALYTTPPAQPAPVQPVGTYGEIHESMQALLRSGLQRDQQIYMAMKDRPLYTTPPAAPDLQAELDATNRQVEILSDALAESRREVARLKAVQEPFGYFRYDIRLDAWVQSRNSNQGTAFYTTPPAQPVVPDAFGTREGEHPQYIQGWNDCFAEMLRGMKP